MVVRCSVCGEEISREHFNIDANGHTPGEPVRENEVPATCSKEGSYDEVVYCEACDEEISRTEKTIEKLAHTPDDPVRENEVPATCSEEGSYDEVIYCEVCDEEISRTPKTIEKLAHTPGEPVRENEVPATCLKEGSYDEVVYCEVCGDEISRKQITLEKSAHNYSNGKCRVCGAKIEEEFPVTSDDYEIDYQSNAITRTVRNSTEYLDLITAFNMPEGCSWKLYEDFLGTQELALKAMSLAIGHNTVYVIVRYEADADYFTRYTLDVYRLGIKNYAFNDYNGSPLSVGTVEESFTVSAPDDAVRAHYDFVGWAVDGELVTFPYTVNADTTFVATYTPTKYNITYELGGGEFATDINSYNIETAVTFDEPVREYYDFAGWYSDADFSGKSVTGIAVGSYGDKTFYAKWTPTQYDIIYELGGGELTTDINSYNIETAVTFDEPARVGYGFMGWYSNADFEGEPVTGLAVGSYGDRTFYAKWTPTKYNITYELGGGELTTDINSYNIETSVTFDEPVKEYYNFAGWYSNAEFEGEPATGIAVGNFGDKTFYARWTPVVYNIEYVLNGGSFAGDYEATYTIESDTVVFATPQKTDYTFMGWFTSEDFNEELTEIPAGSHGDIKVYAYFQYGTSGLQYTLSGGAYFVSGYSGSATGVIIPAEWNGLPVTAINDSVFSDCSSLISITIPDSVTSIGYEAFYYCSSLKGVYITDIAAWCAIDFGNYSANPLYYAHDLYLNGEIVTNLVVPEGVTGIGRCAFYCCSSLTSVTIPDGVTSIGGSAFYNCSNLTSITIPDGVTSIGDYTFNNCSSLIRVTIGNGVTSIGERAFYNCSSLTSIAIPDSVKSIGEYAFYKCNRLTSVTIGDGVTWIGDCAFYNCSRLTSVTIGNGVTSIGGSAFSGCSSLTGITIPDSVTSIGASAFNNCSSLTSINIPDSVTSISSTAFFGCDKIIQIENGVSYVDKWAIDCDTSVTFVGLRADTVGIAGSAFSRCSSLTSITMPNGVTSIGDSAFSRCSNLTSITIPDSVTSIGYSAFYGCSSLISVTIPDGVTSIGGSAFSGCSRLTSITIPDGVTSIGASAFRDCSRLTSITIPDGVTSIGGSAFRDCSRLTRVIIPGSVTSIGSFAFYDCSGLDIVYYGGASQSEWSDIEIMIDNSDLTSATRYYYSEEPPLTEDGTAYNGNYWRYVDGVPTIWVKEQ